MDRAEICYTTAEQNLLLNSMFMDGLEPNNKLTREQKIAVAMLFVFALLTAGLAFLQIRNNLVTPFVLREQQEKGQKSLKDFQVELQNIDTDQDTINDYEELNFYSTSPYLPDTDSDGKTDKEEIDAGTNPLCAEGKECESTENLPSTTSTASFTLFPLNQLGQSLSGIGVDPEVAAKDVEALMNDPQKIRQLLLQSGQIPESELLKLDDATLLKILQETISQPPQSSPSVPDSDSNVPEVPTPTSSVRTVTSTPQEQIDQ